MGESQCPHCGHVVTGFEQQEFEIKHAAECESADTIARLRADLREALEALKPFAEYAEHVARVHPGWNHDDFTWGDKQCGHPKLKAYRLAASILASHKENPDG